MKALTRVISITALTATAVTLVSGTAAATSKPGHPTPKAASVTPAPDSDTLSTEIASGVRYTSNMRDRSVVVQTGFGTLTALGGQFRVTDPQGHTLLGAPQFAVKPKAEETVERQSSATPGTGHSNPRPKSPTPHVVDDDAGQRFEDAFGVLSNEVGMAVTVGSLVGGAAGSVGGCLLGGTVGTVVLPEVFFASLPAGCLVGLGIGMGIGTLVGSVAFGIPVGIASYDKMQRKLNTPKP